MKKLALSLSSAAVALVAGCSSPSDNLCIEQATCAGEDDPAAFCQEQKADLDEDQQRVRDACQSQNDASATCLLENGSCQDLSGVKVFTIDDADDCAEEFEAAAECAADNA
jgi:hypothetical protein